MTAGPRHECSECSFVGDPETLITFLIPREQRETANKKPKFVGKFTMLNWTGHSNFYLFKCQDCGEITVDYPHGYTNNDWLSGLLYLYCQKCGARLILYESNIYQKEGLPAPPGFWKTLRELWKIRRRVKRQSRLNKKGIERAIADIEDKHGVRVLFRKP